MRLDSTRLLRTLTTRVPAVVLVAGLVGCVTVPSSPNERSGRPRPLDFSELEINDRLVTVGHPHGVNVVVELAEEDVPEGAARRFLNEGQYRAAMFVSDEGEHFRAGPHQFSYSNGRFHVGSASYTSAPNARLIILKKRRDGVSFRFHQQRIVVPVDGRWLPAIYYSIRDVTADGAATSRLPRTRRRDKLGRQIPVVTRTYPIETLQIGSRRITVDSRDGRWRVDGRAFTPSADRNMILEGVAHFAEE